MARTRLVKKHRAFLAAFRECASITLAAKACGIDRSMHYDFLETVTGYPEAFERAREQAADVLVDEGIRRAREGVVRRVYWKGKPVGVERVYSDGLLVPLLDRLRPRDEDAKTDAAPPPFIVTIQQTPKAGV
jgi:hypothetical protein